MERMERVNSSFDLEYDYYKKNLPALDQSVDSQESIDLYEKIFESRKTFTVLGLDSYIVLDKKSLNKIADMINAHPQEYVLFTQHQVVDEDKFDKLLEKERDQLNPIFIPEPENEKENENDIKEGFKNDIDGLIDKDTFKISLWLYLFLILCSICNFLFLIYIATKTDIGFGFFTGYTSYLFGLLLFTGIFGFFKCRAYDFTGCLLQCSTYSISFSGLIGIIIFLASKITFKVFWMKLIVDIITIIIGVILILYLSGLIEKKELFDHKKEALLKSEDTKV